MSWSFRPMQTQRKAILDSQAELDADSGPAKRRQSGIGARGQGIRVEGDEPFDPYRFQTFEVTPAFRQSILEAPLPLPDRFLEEVPQSQSGHRAGPDDVTLPQIAMSNLSLRPMSQPKLELPIPLARPVQHSTVSAKSTHRRWVVLAVAASAWLGLAFAHLYTRAARPAKLEPPPAAVDVPLLPAVVVKANQPKQVQDLPAGHDANPAANANVPRALSAASRKKPPADKKLWLPVE